MPSPPLTPKYQTPYTGTAMLLGTKGMKCKNIHSDDALRIDKCYYFGGYSGHKGASGVGKRTFRVYTGPKSAYYVLRQHEASLRSWIADEEDRMRDIWDSMGRRRYYKKGKSGANRFNVPFDCMGECKRGQKELGARYIGHSFRRLKAKKALELQKSLNDALQAGGGVPQIFVQPLLLDPDSYTPSVQHSDPRVADVQRQADIGIRPDYVPWRESLDILPDDVIDTLRDMPADQSGLTDDWGTPSPEIPTWMWAVGGAGAAFVLYRIMKK